MMRKQQWVQGFMCAMLGLGSLSGVALAQESTRPETQTMTAQPVASLVGTTWSGFDSEGEFYAFTFLKGGQLRFKNQRPGESMNSYEDEGDIWAQNGKIVVFTMSDFATYLGEIKGDEIVGKSWNVNGQRWTWTVKLQK